MVIPHDTPIPITGPPSDVKKKPLEEFLKDNNLTETPTTIEFPIKDDDDGLKVLIRIFSNRPCLTLSVMGYLDKIISWEGGVFKTHSLEPDLTLSD